MKDALGDRMKTYYEDVTRAYLPRRTYTIIRVDGKAFHTFTRKFEKPFDVYLIGMMNQTAKYLAENVQGCKMAFVQSDEISLVLTDFDDLNTSAWFDGNIQKITSVVASMATKAFNKAYLKYFFEYAKDIEQAAQREQIPYHLYTSKLMSIVNDMKFAEFDARVFTIPSKAEVMNYFVWRQKDATRNSISMVAQSLYSHKELNGKSTDQMQEMIFQKGTNWNNYDDGMKRGRCIVRRAIPLEVADMSGRIKEYFKPELKEARKKWVLENPPIFTEDWTYLSSVIPENH